MPLCLDLFLVGDRYDAADGQDPRAVEWPPHPARVFSALRSVATDDDLPALRELERLSPPAVHASGTVAESSSRSYVVTNALASAGGNLNHPGRTSGLRTRRSVFPERSRVQFIWTPDDAITDDSVARLDSLARRVPYLGRSTSVALLGVRRVDDVVVPDGLHRYVPCSDGQGDLQLRVPYPGYLDALNALHESGSWTWQASDGARARRLYQRIAEPSGTEGREDIVLRSAYRDLVILRFRSHRPAGRLAPIFTAALRSKVMSQTDEPLPPALHGHGYDGNPHVAYLALPVCGGPFADGRLVGLAVAVPGMDEFERRRILRGILHSEDEGRVMLKVPGFREEFTLDYRPQDSRPWSATERYWVRASRQWVTSTPIVLDRYPKDGDLASAVLASFALAGLPEPALVEVSRSALTTGAIELQPRELPRRARGRLYCHARATFDQPVAGPMLVGAGRYFGVGLLQPESSGGDPSDD